MSASGSSDVTSESAASRVGAAPRRAISIVHCFRAPVGGLFRHVRDLVEAQARNGHRVGIICDSSTGGAYEEELFATLRAVARPWPDAHADAPADRALRYRRDLAPAQEVRALDPDILHAHGAKGGAYARVIGTLLRVWYARSPHLLSPRRQPALRREGAVGARLFRRRARARRG